MEVGGGCALIPNVDKFEMVEEQVVEKERYEIVKFEQGDLILDVSVSPIEDTVQLTQKQLSLLFDVSVDNISLHVKNILKERELDESVVEESSVTASDG